MPPNFFFSFSALFYAVGIGAGGIEHNDALLRAAIQRDVVDARAGSGHAHQILRELHLMHGRASDQNAVRLIDIFRLLIFVCKIIQSDLGDRI